MEFVFKYRGVEQRLSLAFAETTLEQLGRRIEADTAAHYPTQKLIGPNLKTALHLAENANLTLHDAGLLPRKRYTLIGSPEGDVSSVQSMKELPRMRGFEEEAQREAQRRRYPTASVKPPNVEYGFGRYEVLQRESNPSPEAALKLLYRLANDAGIQGVMKNHRWNIGRLSEMPPEGKVGVSRMCVLGYNVNKGQEISLRLRTDDRKGFRKYETIRETLIHELTHMVWSDHDENFKKLNSELLRECGRVLAAAQGHYLIDAVAEEPEDTPIDGQHLGGDAATLDARSAAAQAAIQRQRRFGDPTETQKPSLP